MFDNSEYRLLQKDRGQVAATSQVSIRLDASNQAIEADRKELLTFDIKISGSPLKMECKSHEEERWHKKFM
ncbi:hypothetical protein ACKFKF_23580 [Phormidesmis sp. 146-12]